jgi:hypothetical protein
MRFLRRLAGLLCGGAGATGLVLGVAGLVGVWVGYGEVVRRVDRVFDGADRGLAGIQENLRQAADRLRETETELEAVRKREADLAARPPAERPGRREASRKLVEGLGPGVAEARATLVKATEAALVANGVLDALAELPAVERVNVDTDRLKEASAQLAELTERSTRLAEMLARAAPPSDEVEGESSRAVAAVRRPIALAEAGSDRLESGRQSIATGHARVLRWINGLAAALTVVLVWIAAGQLSLLIHGWKLLRRSP